MITVTTAPGRYLITVPKGTKDRNPQLVAAVKDAKAMAKLFGFDVEVIREDGGVGHDFQPPTEDRAPSTSRKNTEIPTFAVSPGDLVGS